MHPKSILSAIAASAVLLFSPFGGDALACYGKQEPDDYPETLLNEVLRLDSRAMADREMAKILSKDYGFMLVKDLIRFGRYEDAIETLENIVWFYPTPDVYYRAGKYLEFMGQTKLALRCYKVALGIDPYYENAWKRIGVIHVYSEGDVKDTAGEYLKYRSSVLDSCHEPEEVPEARSQAQD